MNGEMIDLTVGNAKGGAKGVVGAGKVKMGGRKGGGVRLDTKSFRSGIIISSK